MIWIKATSKWIPKILKLRFIKIAIRRNSNFLVSQKVADMLIAKGYATLVEATPPPEEIISNTSSSRKRVKAPGDANVLEPG